MSSCWRSTPISSAIFAATPCIPRRCEVMDELGLIDEFLKLPHQQSAEDGRHIRRRRRSGSRTLSRLPSEIPLHRLHAAVGFSRISCRSGRRYPSFNLHDERRSDRPDLVGGAASPACRATTPEGAVDIRADLTIGCDGRHSMVRERAGLAVEDIGAPIDVLWFRVRQARRRERQCLARIDTGKMMVMFDRGDYWQCAYVIPKGNTRRSRPRASMHSATRSSASPRF